jgi:hypothetical protein
MDNVDNGWSYGGVFSLAMRRRRIESGAREPRQDRKRITVNLNVEMRHPQGRSLKFKLQLASRDME